MKCNLCKRHSVAKPCEVYDSPLTEICKHCCIGEMNGHKCPWFDICWGK